MSMDLAARLRGIIYQLGQHPTITRQQLVELRDIASKLEKSRIMSERLRIHLFGLLDSVRSTKHGAPIILHLQNYKSCLAELHAIIDEVRPRSADELSARRS